MALHFVGFRDERVYTARLIFGLPDFYHRNWDYRAFQESSVPGDVIVFATGDEHSDIKSQGWDDSQQNIVAIEYFDGPYNAAKLLQEFEIGAQGLS